MKTIMKPNIIEFVFGSRNVEWLQLKDKHNERIKKLIVVVKRTKRWSKHKMFVFV